MKTQDWSPLSGRDLCRGRGCPTQSSGHMPSLRVQGSGSRQGLQAAQTEPDCPSCGAPQMHLEGCARPVGGEAERVGPLEWWVEGRTKPQAPGPCWASALTAAPSLGSHAAHKPGHGPETWVRTGGSLPVRGPWFPPLWGGVVGPRLPLPGHPWLCSDQDPASRRAALARLCGAIGAGLEHPPVPPLSWLHPRWASPAQLAPDASEHQH